MNLKVAGLFAGMGFGFLLSWARLSDPTVIRNMLLLREAHVFLIMGSAVVVAAVGLRLLRIAGSHAFVTGEAIGWSVQRPEPRHVIGSVIFGAGWSVAGTCPGPVAAMIGEGKLGGLAVAAGLLAGVALQQTLVGTPAIERRPAAAPDPGGL
jgi:uncharacterized membrane protein YedE/YeeE